MDAKRKQAEKIITERRAVGWFKGVVLDLPNMSDEQIYRFMKRVGFRWSEVSNVWMYQHTLFEVTEGR
jgi:hypothetical protein